MDGLIYIGGEFADGAARTGSPYIYQYIRTDGHKPLMVEEHLRRLNDISWQVRRCGADIPARAVTEGITRLLRRGGYSDGASHTAALRLHFDGGASLHYHGTSLYEKFTMRALRPQALLFEAYAPHCTLPTSAAEAQTALLREEARTQGAGAFIAADADGRLLSVDGATPVAVRGREIIFGSASLGVEEEWFFATAERNRRRVRIAELHRDELPHLDELGCIDHRGITSIACCDGTFYGDIILNAVAERM